MQRTGEDNVDVHRDQYHYQQPAENPSGPVKSHIWEVQPTPGLAVRGEASPTAGNCYRPSVEYQAKQWIPF